MIPYAELGGRSAGYRSGGQSRPSSATLLAQGVVQLPLVLLLQHLVQGFPLRVRLLLEDGAIHLEDASHGGYVHRSHVASFSGILDQERAAGEHVLPRNRMTVLVLRVVKFPQES